MYPCSENKDADQLCSVTAQLICVFVLAYAICLFSHAAAHIQMATLLTKALRAIIKKCMYG